VIGKTGTLYNDAVLEGKDGWLFWVRDNAIADFQGINPMSVPQMDQYVKRMEELQLVCEAQGKQLYYLIPPNKEQVYSEYMPDYPVQDLHKRAHRLADYVKANSEVKISYPLLELSQAKFYCNTYLKHDSHWSNCGAFIGSQVLYEMMGLPVTPLYLQARAETPMEGGDLLIFGRLNPAEYEDGNFDYIINYKPEVECISPQDGDFSQQIYYSESSSENPQKIVVIGDSYCMKMTPFLMKDFAECLVLHKNHLKDPFVVQKLQDADVIVIEALERMTYSLLKTSSDVKGILAE